MVTQKPISLKIDSTLLERLNAEAQDTCNSRNKLINEAVKVYLELLKAQRYQRYENTSEKKVCREALLFIKKYLVHDVQFFLDVIDHH